MVVADISNEEDGNQGRIRSLLGDTSTSWYALEQAFMPDVRGWADEVVARLDVAMMGESPLLLETDVDLDRDADPTIRVFALTESRRISLMGTFGTDRTMRRLAVTVQPRAGLRSILIRSLTPSDDSLGRAASMKLTLRYDSEDVVLGHERTTHVSEEAAAAVYSSLLRDLA